MIGRFRASVLASRWAKRSARRSLPGDLHVLAALSIVAAVLAWPSTGSASQPAVTGLTLTSASPGTLVVTWDVPDQVPTDYRVNWAKSSEEFPSYRSSGGNAYPDTNSFNVPDPEEGVEYKVRVRARYKGAQLIGDQTRFSTAWTEVERITVASLSRPARPRGLTGTTTHNSVTLTWNTSNDSTITSYQILRRQSAVHDVGDFQTLENNTGSNATTYVDTAVEAGKRYVYRIKARNAAGLSGWSNFFSAKLPDAPVTTPTLPPQREESQVTTNDDPPSKNKGGTLVRSDPNSPATGAPTISGTTRVGETLTADTSAITDDDGLTNASYSYQWVRTDDSDDTNIDGATSSTYTLVAADVGKTIKVTVSFKDDDDNAETLTSAASGTVRPIWRDVPAWPVNQSERGGRSSTDLGNDGIVDYVLIPQSMTSAESFEIQWWVPICWFTLSSAIKPYCPDAGDAAAQTAEEQRAERRGIPAYLKKISVQQPTTDSPGLKLSNLPVEGMYVVRIRAINEHGDPSSWSEYVYLYGVRGDPESDLRWVTESEVMNGSQ